MDSLVSRFFGSLADYYNSAVVYVKNKFINAENYARIALDGTWRVCPFGALPQWMQDNDYLLHFHRPPMPSFSLCFQSVFRVHSETVNIWTHLLGFLFHLCLALFFMSKPSSVVPLEAKIIFAIFFASILFCLSMSCMCHTVSCHSPEVDNLFRKMDYCGISVLIMGSCLSWIYYAFYTRVIIMTAYVILVGLIGMFVIVVSFWDLLGGPLYRPHRSLMFSTFALGAAVPTFHCIITEGFTHPRYFNSFCTLYLSGFLYLLGGGFYALRIPEKYYPGSCDLIFQSHQIFHILIIIASFLHYCAIYSIAFSAYSKVM